MRLRSSQLVFLMLLVCSVRIGEEYAAQLTAAVAGPASLVAAPRDNPSAHAEPGSSLSPRPTLARTSQLSPAARATCRTAWTMPAPASASASIMDHTSFLRA